MATCKIPQNQPIYHALIEKANSYPSNEYYKANAYKKVAESVLNHTWDINEIAKKGTWWQGQGQHVPGIGGSTISFISDFVRCAPTIAPVAPVAPALPSGGVSSAQLRPLPAPDTKGSGPFGYLADADETEEDDFHTTLIPTCRKITVQQLIDALQAAVKKNTAVADMEVVPDLLDDSNLGPYEVIIDNHIVFINSGHRNPY
jgi:hypothetical protein